MLKKQIVAMQQKLIMSRFDQEMLQFIVDGAQEALEKAHSEIDQAEQTIKNERKEIALHKCPVCQEVLDSEEDHYIQLVVMHNPDTGKKFVVDDPCMIYFHKQCAAEKYFNAVQHCLGMGHLTRHYFEKLENPIEVLGATANMRKVEKAERRNIVGSVVSPQLQARLENTILLAGKRQQEAKEDIERLTIEIKDAENKQNDIEVAVKELKVNAEKIRETLCHQIHIELKMTCSQLKRQVTCVLSEAE